MNDKEELPFFSIKWKALLLFGFLLGISHSIQYAFSYKQISSQFQQQRNQEQKNQLSIIQTFVDQSARVMEQVVDISLPHSFVTSKKELINIFEQQWGNLQDNWGIASIRLYSKQNQLKKIFGLDNPQLIPAGSLENAFQLERPSYELVCKKKCYQIIYIPILTNQKPSLLVFIRSLADIIITFEKATRTDIAILKLSPNNRNTPDVRFDITASSHPENISALYSQLSQQYSAKKLLDKEIITTNGNKTVGVRLFKLSESKQDNGPYILLATDLTKEYLLIAGTKTESLYVILFALAFSVICIFPILLNRTQRLIHISNLLPALSKGEFQFVKKSLQKKHFFQWSSDEVDTLERATLLVADQLEKGNQMIKETQDNLIWLADHDALTQLFNRRRFQAEFEQQLKIAERYKNMGAILYLDLDQFKYINDTSGHAVGDVLLKRVAETLQHIVRSSDVLARLGGDEFVLLMPDTDIDGASQTAQKILDELHSIPFVSNGSHYTITASIGIATFPEKSMNTHDFMSHADIAMYQAKESGRGKAHIYSHEEQTKEKLHNRILWKEKIESALIEKRLTLHFQPILDINSNKVSHIEALVRMIDKDSTIIMPNDFIPTAEQSGLINQIDMAVLGLAFETLRCLTINNSPLKLSINFSGKAFNNNLLIKQLKDGLCENDINPEKLIIEVTETTAVANFNTAVQMMKDIKKLGVKFALDDFGVGYASFFYLRQLPVDYVKIDGSFIQQLDNNEEDQILVQAIAKISNLSGKKTIAEFVENQAILDLLKTYNIDYAQGYHIAKPSADIPDIDL